MRWFLEPISEENPDLHKKTVGVILIFFRYTYVDNTPTKSMTGARHIPIAILR